MYLVKTPGWLKALYPSLVWNKNTTEKKIYLTFDDGPHITATPFVLQTLEHYKAKATFFCIGKNVLAYPSIYQQIIQNGHRVGNHTQNHVNGFKTTTTNYIQNIVQAEQYIESNLFRPPYGRITTQQIKNILKKNATPIYKGCIDTIIMWSVLSGDFDIHLSKEKCLQHVLHHTTNGSIVVFHDSTKAWERMHYALPKMLHYFTQQGYMFDVL